MSESGGNYEKPKLTETSLPKIVAKLKSTDRYKILGVKRGATEAQIKSAFRDRSRERHPDKARTEADRKLRQELTAETNVARDTLVDPQRRVKYDTAASGISAQQAEAERQKTRGWEAGAARGEATAKWEYTEEGRAERDRIYGILGKTLKGESPQKFLSEWAKGWINEGSSKLYRAVVGLIENGKLGLDPSQLRDLAIAGVLAAERSNLSGGLWAVPTWVENHWKLGANYSSGYEMGFVGAWGKVQADYAAREMEKENKIHDDRMKQFAARAEIAQAKMKDEGKQWGVQAADVFFDATQRVKTLRILETLAKSNKITLSKQIAQLDADGVHSLANAKLEEIGRRFGSGTREERIVQMRNQLQKLESARKYIINGVILGDPTVIRASTHRSYYDDGFRDGWGNRALVGLKLEFLSEFPFIPREAVFGRSAKI